MQATTVVIPYRAGDDPERRANLEAVLAHLETTGAEDIVLVEQDIAPTLGDLPPRPFLRALFTYSPAPFNKSWAMNVGMRASAAPCVAFLDADLLCPGLPRAAAGARQGIPVVRAYAHCIDLDRKASAKARTALSRSEPPTLAAGARRTAQGEVPPSCGGAVVFQRRILGLIGGWDERFQGWGGEDDAMDHKLQRCGIRPGIVEDSPAFHLHHARAASQPGFDALYRNNFALLEQLRAMPDDALRRLCEVSLQLAGNPDMYRPLEPLP